MRDGLARGPVAHECERTRRANVGKPSRKRDMDTIAELEPCPFCGSSGVLVGSFVRCGKCGAVGPYGSTQAEAADRWNQRVDMLAQGAMPVLASIHAGAKAGTEPH